MVDRGMSRASRGYLVLEDGSYFSGTLFGGLRSYRALSRSVTLETLGEVVFNTAMCGYEEVLSDPSYHGQIVVMTTSHVGNYGITLQDQESSKVHVAGMAVMELAETPSNWRARKSLDEYLRQHKVAGLFGIDTSAVTKHLRSTGTMRGAIVAVGGRTGFHPGRTIEKIRRHPVMEGLALAQDVSVAKPRLWRRGRLAAWPNLGERRPRIAVLDFGIKWSILRNLSSMGFAPVVVPWRSRAGEILAINPKGIVLSNGPGDPAALIDVIGEIRSILKSKRRAPILGICLGHQLLGLASGGRTYKMKFGHHGVNHPVQDTASRRVWISSHNHGFAVDPDTLASDVRVTFTSLNDGAVEGIESEERRFFSVQFHPESAPGPWEARGIFQRFREMALPYAPS